LTTVPLFKPSISGRVWEGLYKNIMRTLDQINQGIKADFVANEVLQEAYGLDETKLFDDQFSKVSLESIIIYIVATAIWLLEVIVSQKETELESQIASEYPYSISWYYNKALSFQLGDWLAFDTNYKFSYPVIDEAKRIVKFVAIRQREVEGVTTLQVFSTKAAKEALIEDEMAAFTAYMQQIGAAGTHFEFISLPPDNISLELVCVYNPQLLTLQGDRLGSSGKPVNEAIEAFLDGIKYGGSFSRTKLIDAIQMASGVIDIELGNVLLNGVLNATRSFESPSGFFKSLAITVTYTPGYDI